ncbi:putative ABC transporter permease [[Clostridium] sordellii]|uniref:ABC transporter permease n=1 Tax=Paraclostridium sordellii TaxID=1505 RepID=UPI0005E8A93D|nr:ABC transporter permease [Paeniclostridium sordellii]MBX9180174.1 ABC transporter permease [Paeniclostridium sordellii]MDU1453407.1 ABC transporter permease [Paeniclostridium sordellii]CEO10701.1 putative ABC transporter permease [[Clostridium] sordellii] [Paeniclostridium sordellii]CEP80029.1 putative ABC transporter permease [[Clostridium] sordellii] [Paeniclostridium sordellii]
MKQFLTVLKFELSNYFQKKSFIISTVIIAAAIVIGLSLPNFIDMSSILPVGDKAKAEKSVDEDKTNFAIYDKNNVIPDKKELNTYFKNSNWKVVKNQDELDKLVKNKDVEAGFNVKSLTEYDYVVQNTKFNDENKYIFDELLKKEYRENKITSEGIDFNKVDAIYNTQVVSNVEILGKDSANNYFYAYMLIFIIYMMIIMYGQLIAMGITAEKSNRAIEVLVTSTNTNNLIFGKVIAGAIASIVQVGVIMSSALIAYKVNSDVWNGILDNVFKIPSELIVTFAIFGILGYLFYSFIFGALGALVSKTEDIGSSIGPIVMIFVVVFFISIYGLNNGDSTLIKVCSYIPFSSPMTMLVRVATGYATLMEFIISALILIASTVLAGIGGAKIYRMATLMYGNPVKLKNALKWLKVKGNQ